MLDRLVVNSDSSRGNKYSWQKRMFFQMVEVELRIYNVEKSSIPNERVKRAVTSIVIMAPLHRSSSSPLFSLVNRRAAHRRSTSAKPIQSLWTRTWPFSCRYGTMAVKITRWRNLIPSLRPHALHPGEIQGKEGIEYCSAA